jgi:hypothetical protein
MNESPPGKLKRKNPPNWDLLASAAMGVSGFVAARAALAVNIHGFGFEAPHARILALASAGALCILFAATRRKTIGFANCMLFAAAYIIGLIQVR